MNDAKDENEKYRAMLQKAWEGSRGGDEPLTPPSKFAQGFYAGLYAASEYVVEKPNENGLSPLSLLDVIRIGWRSLKGRYKVNYVSTCD